MRILGLHELRRLSLDELEKLKRSYEEERSRLFRLYNARELSEIGRGQLENLWNFGVPSVERVIKEKQEKRG